MEIHKRVKECEEDRTIGCVYMEVIEAEQKGKENIFQNEDACLPNECVPETQEFLLRRPKILNLCVFHSG